MRYRFMRFPEGKTKAVTLSYDDGLSTDLKLCEVLNQHGMKCTLNINSRWLADEDNCRNISKTKLTDFVLATGHEVAVHGAQHVAPGKARVIDALKDALECRHELEKLTGRIIRGMAYPDSGITVYCNGATYLGVKQYLMELDIVYARSLAADNNRFLMPTDWHNWIPTAHHKNQQVMEWAKQFASIDVNSLYEPDRYPRLFYLWGHTYEFENDNNWSLLEDLCETLGHKDDTWYATNMEIYEYTAAYDSLVFSVDNTIIHNPSNQTVWFDSDKKLHVIHPGQTIRI